MEGSAYLLTSSLVAALTGALIFRRWRAGLALFDGPPASWPSSVITNSVFEGDVTAGSLVAGAFPVLAGGLFTIIWV